MKKKIIVGLDFDGVVAYNPFRIIRAPVTFFKRNILGDKSLHFYVPKSRWQQIFWTILHESSVFPGKGTGLLRQLVKDDVIEAHLVTARYSFLDNHLFAWLERYKMKKLFKTITFNKHDEQPHLYKEKIIKKYNFDYFVEDNWDIVEYLAKKRDQKKLNTEIYWIYNLLDRGFIPYRQKHPYLKNALETITKKHKVHLANST